MTLVVCVAENNIDCRFSVYEFGLSVRDAVELTSWEDLDNLLHLLLETNLEDTIRLVNDQRFEVLENESFCVLRSVTPSALAQTHLEMIQQTTWRCDNQVDTLGQLVRLGLSVGSSHQNTKSLRMTLHELFGDTKDLQSELSSR